MRNATRYAMLEGHRIRSDALRSFWTRDDARKINADWRNKVVRILNALDVAAEPVELDLPGFGFHALRGDRNGMFSVSVTRNWRVTFRWDEDGPYEVDLEDYNGR